MTTIESQIAKDLDACDIMEVLGTPAAKRKARKHRKACFAALKEMNRKDGVPKMNDKELLAALLS